MGRLRAHFVCLPSFMPANFKGQAGRSQGLHNRVCDPKFRSPRCCLFCSQNRDSQCVCRQPYRSTEESSIRLKTFKIIEYPESHARLGLSCTPHLMLHPSWLLSTKSWNFLKSEYEILRLRIKCTRTFRATVHIAAVIGWKRSRKEGQGKLSLAPNLLLNWISCPRWSTVYLFFVFLETSSPMWPDRTKQGVPVPSIPDFTDDFIGKDFTGPWTYSKNNYLEATQCN